MASLRSRLAGELRHPALVVLAGALAIGALVRGWLMLQWRPAFLGFPDTVGFLLSATGDPFADGSRPTGYSRFVIALHAVADELSLVPLVQHGLGLASALMLYAALRLLGAGRWVAIAPAVVVALHGTLIFLEHAVLTESLFLALLSATLLLVAAATAPGRRTAAAVALCVAAGLLLGYATWVRTVGFFVVPPVVAFAGLAAGTAGVRIGRAVALAAAVAGVALAISAWHESKTGYGGYTVTGYYNAYGRVATFAECGRFDPPAGTEMLCIDMPVEQREGHDAWIHRSTSPLIRAYGAPLNARPPHDASGKVSAFVRAAVLGQPLDYLRTVGRDLVRIVQPTFPASPTTGNAAAGTVPDVLVADLIDEGEGQRYYVDVALAGRYSTVGSHHEDIGPLLDYESATRLTGVPMALLVLLGLLAPLLARPGLRLVGALLLLCVVALVVMPILTSLYSWRYEVPSIPLLAGAAALTLDGLVWQRRARAPAR